MITPADLALPACGLAAYAAIVDLEQALTRLFIKFDDIEKLARKALTRQQIAAIERLRDERRARNLELDFAHSLDLTCRFDILGRYAALYGQLEDGWSKNKLNKLKHRAQGVRNSLAHGSDLLAIAPDVRATPRTVMEIDAVGGKVWKLVADTPWTEFSFADIWTNSSGRPTYWAGDGATPSLKWRETWVITADNPRSIAQDSDPEHWHAEQNRLRDALKDLQVRYVELSAGRGAHVEHSFGIGNIDRARVLELARAFGQLGVFRLDADTQQVIDTNGVVRRAIPRRR